MSPRLASAITMRPAAVASAMSRSSSAIPAEPWRSKKATCGFTTLTAPAKPSTQPAQKARRPAASSRNPHLTNSAADGSMPAHSGPVLATAAATRSPKLSAMSSSFVQRWERDARGTCAFGRRSSGAGEAPAHRPADVPHRRFVGLAPARQLAEHLPRRPGIPEGGGADLNGIGAGHEQLHGVVAGEDASHADDRQLGEGRAAFPHGAYGHRVHRTTGQPAPAGAQDGPSRLDVEGEAQQRVHEGQPVGTTLHRSDCDL